ncbi:hypothetical protein ABZ468_25150 [Streptomyces sp. NPDC005708]|uniref:hypothetical protein n=1 Tax=Streptomyces sp. NPDC005708 TaxID=3154564 RepID=UPI0033F8F34C
MTDPLLEVDICAAYSNARAVDVRAADQQRRYGELRRLRIECTEQKRVPLTEGLLTPGWRAPHLGNWAADY